MYIDVLVAVNIIIDFLLLLCVKSFLNLRTPLKRLIAGSALGGIFSLIALLPRLPFGLNIAVDIFTAAVITLAAFRGKGFKSRIKQLALYFIFSFIFCGMMIFIYTAFKPKGMEIYNDVVYFNISPLLLIILTLICYYILKLIKRLTAGANGAGVCCVEAFFGGKSYVFNAKIDTACNVKEPFSGDYVLIAEKELLSGFSPNALKARVIPFESLGGSGILQGFKPEKLKLNGEEANGAYIGICENVLKGDVKALVPYEITKNLN